MCLTNCPEKPKGISVSWVAYFKATIIMIFVSLLIVAPMIEFDVSLKYTLPVSAIILFFYIINVVYYKNNYIYMDENGVWMHAGVFPWQKGITGVSWQNLDKASYYTGFSNWLFKYNKIKLQHRFTQDSEVVMNYVHRGQNVVERINRILYKINNS